MATLYVIVVLSWPSAGMESKSSSARSHLPHFTHALAVAFTTIVFTSTPCSRMASNISTHLDHSPFFLQRVENIVNALGSRLMGASASFSAAFITAATPPGGACKIS
eukprot:30957-Pelagococcus_subviridis.AAC.60